MAGNFDPGYNSNMQRFPIPTDPAKTDAEAQPNLVRVPPVPGRPDALVDALIGDPAAPGRPFIREVSSEGQTDVPDPGV